MNRGMMDWSGRDSAMPGIVVNVTDKAALIGDLNARFSAKQGFSVATINLDHVVKLRTDPAFFAAYRAQSHITADGVPIVWLSRLAGQKDVCLAPGSELIDPIVELAARENVPIGLFGSTQTSLEAASRVLKQKYPLLEVLLVRAPVMGFDPAGPEADAAIDAIAASGVRLVLLALGAPKQERFAAYAQTRLPEVGFLSIGAGLDFISGAQRRAPVWVRKIAAEWIWRMLGNPRRLAARYGACIMILPGLVRKALDIRRGDRQG